MADGSFEVDLSDLNSAIVRVSAERDVIRAGIAQVKAIFSDIEDHWVSPSGNSFVALANEFNSVSDELLVRLDDAIDRMRVAYRNYANTEATNTGNYR
jgi:hypothetical protein